MALSPTDFYAYSRATGTPFPEDPEERAQLAPEVLEFRRNQLKVPEQSPDYGAIAGLTVAGLGLAAGGVGLVRMLKGRTLQGLAKNVNKQAQAAEPVVQNVVKTGVPVVRTNLEAVQPSKVVDQSPQQNTLVARDRAQELIDEYIGNINLEQKEFAPQTKSEQMQQLAELNRQRGFANRAIKSKGEQVLAEIQNEAKPFNLAYIESTGAKAPDLTSIQQAETPQIAAQQQAAIESGEDQITGRIKHRLQQNENLDTSQIEIMEEIAEQQYRIGMEQEDPTLPRVVSSQEFADLAKQEMINRRQALQASGLRPGTERFERALAQSFTTKSIPGAEPGTVNFRNLQDLNKIDIALPSTIRKAVNVVEEINPEDALEPKTLRAVLNIGPSAEITTAASGTAIRGASPIYHESLPKQKTRQLFGTPDVLVRGAPDELAADIPGRQRVSSALSADVPAEELSKQEIQYSFLNQTPIETIKGGSAGIGLYGIEPKYVPGAVSKVTGEYSEKASQKPSFVPGWLLRQEQTPFSSVSNEGLQRALEKSSPSGARSIIKEIERREKANKSLIVSEALRRAKIEGRDPQMILKQLGIGI